MSTAQIDLASLQLTGPKGSTLRANVLEALEELTVSQTITGASTVQMTLSDPHRTLLRSGLLSVRTTVIVAGSAYELAQVAKSGPKVTVTFEDIAVAALRLKKGARSVAAGKMSRAQFCTTLIREVGWVKVASAPGAKSLVQLSRGSGATAATGETVGPGGWGNFGSTSTTPTPATTTTTTKSAAATKADEEDTWTAVTRILGEIDWRVCVIGGVVYLAPDSWLMSHAKKTYALSESSPGVDNIDVDWDVGKPAATATMQVWSGYTDLTVGSPVTLSGMGPGNGSWLVESITRKAHTKLCDVQLIHPQPTLPEPADTGAGLGGIGEGGWGSFTIPDTAAGGPGTLQVTEHGGGGLTICERFVQYALSANGKPYVWGASGPNSWDCSGLVQWAAGKVGVSLPKPVSSQSKRLRYIPVQQAIATRGALIFRGMPGVSGSTDHIVISLGNGYTIEARGKNYGCGIFPLKGRQFTGAGVIPAIPPDTTARDIRGG